MCLACRVNWGAVWHPQQGDVQSVCHSPMIGGGLLVGSLFDCGWLIGFIG